ncbi:MAG: winged helix-turn-helix domain-containing protein, partial [Pseudomonadota bacterium]
MPSDLEIRPFTLGDVQVDPVDKVITHPNGAKRQVEARHMQVLVQLALAEGEVVSSSALTERCWKQTSQVNPIPKAVFHLRDALGDDAKHPTFIQTVSRSGYRLLLTPRLVDADEPVVEPIDPEPGETRPSRLLLGAAMLLLIAVVGALIKFVWAPAPESPPNSIVVLGLKPEAGSQDLDYLGNGIADAIRIRLGELSPNLEIASGLASNQVSGERDSIVQIGRRLNVRYVLSGSIRRVSPNMIATIAVDDTRSQREVWSGEFSEPEGDLLALERSVAQQVADIIPIVFATEVRSSTRDAGVTNRDAYELFLRGQQVLRGLRNQVTLKEAVGYFEQALAFEEGFVEAKAGLCHAYLSLVLVSRSKAFLEEAGTACEQLRNGDQHLPEATLALGILARERGDYAASERTLRALMRAAKGDKEMVTAALIELADTQFAAREDAKALYNFKLATELDRESFSAQSALANYYMKTGDFTRAEDAYRRVLNLVPSTVRVSARPDSYAKAHQNLASVLWAQQDLKGATANWNEALRLSGGTRIIHTNLGLAAYYAGEFERAAEHQREALEFARDDYALHIRLAETLRFIEGGAQES